MSSNQTNTRFPVNTQPTGRGATRFPHAVPSDRGTSRTQQSEPLSNFSAKFDNVTSKQEPLKEISIEGGENRKGNKFVKGIKNGVQFGGNKVVSIVTDFKTFINRGSVVDLAVALVMGAAFTAIVTSIVQDLITPVIGLLIGKQLSNNHVVLNCNRTVNCNFPTPALAQAAGFATLNYGNFLQTAINFIIISAVVFLIVQAYAKAFQRPAVAKTKKCPFCSRDIPIPAKRCPECTSHLEEAKDE